MDSDEEVKNPISNLLKKKPQEEPNPEPKV